MISEPTNSPSLRSDALRSRVSATSSHPRTGGKKGLARVTSSRWENSSLGFGVAFYELGSGELIVLDQLVNIVYGGHLLKITSMVETYSLTSPLYDHPTLFTRVRGR